MKKAFWRAVASVGVAILRVAYRVIKIDDKAQTEIQSLISQYEEKTKGG